MHKIPVTVITGFLGAGKTTLIRHLLQNNEGRRIAVLVNEFGEIGIDGDLLRDCQICETDEAPSTIVELANGCLCCTVQEEFLPTMQTLLQRRDDLDCIVIETSGLALPKPLVQAFRWPEIRTAATVDSVITVVDCEALARGQVVGDLQALLAQREADDSLDHETPIEELFEDQLACADLVLLTKGDRIPEGDRDSVNTWLAQTLRPGVRVLACQNGAVPASVLLGFNAAVEEQLEQRPGHHDHDHSHDDHDDDIQSVPVILGDCDLEALEAALRQVVQRHTIYRIKGFVAVPHKALRLVIQGVGDRLEHFYDRPWRPGEPRQTRLVVIGHQLDADAIQQQVQAIAPSSLVVPMI
jgi:cobalamin biosynthesis protein CobW